MALSAGTAFVDVQPNIGAGFAGSLTKALGPIGKAAGVALGAGFAAAAGGFAVLKTVGDNFDAAFDTIRIGTGAVGKDFEALKADFKSVFADVPADAQTVATAIADVNTRTGATGETLQELSAQLVQLSRITGEDVGSLVESSTRMFGDWGVAIEDSGAALDALFRASQATGPPVSRLQDLLVRYGAPLRQFGFGMEESAALLGKFEKEGVNTELVMGSMRIALGKLAKAGLEPAEVFPDLIEQIASAGSTAEANALAIETFGARAGPDMAAAIKEGRFAVGDLFDQVADGTETIFGAAADTRDYAEAWQEFKNKASVALEPLAAGLIEQLTEFVDWIAATAVPWLEELAPRLSALGDFFDGVGEAVKDAVGAVAGAFTGAADATEAESARMGGALGAGFGGLRDDANAAVADLDTLGSAGGAAFGGLRDDANATMPVWESVAVVADRTATALGSSITDADVGGAWSGVASSIGDAWNATWETLKQFAGLFVQGFLQTVETLAPIVGPLLAALGDIIGGVLDTIAGLMTVFGGLLTGDWEKAWTGVKDFFLGIWNGLVAAVDSLIGADGSLVTSVSDGLDAIGRIFGVLWEAVTAWVSGLWTSVTDWFTRIRESMSTAIGEAIIAVVGFFRGLPGKIGEVLANLPGQMLDLGKDLLDGIIRGLGDVAGAVFTKIKDGVSGAIENVKGFFGIRSPSLVMANLIGVPLAEGVAVGVGEVGKLTGKALTAGLTDAVGLADRVVGRLGSLPRAATLGGLNVDGGFGDVAVRIILEGGRDEVVRVETEAQSESLSTTVERLVR